MTVRMAGCHPDRKHSAKGLCATCYRGTRPRVRSNPKSVVYMAAWRAANPEKLRDYRARRNRVEARASCKRWAAANPDKVRARNVRQTLGKYGLTPTAYADLLRSQGGVCLVCGGGNGARKLAVDHCHQTGAVRGLLCSGCNYAVGWAEKRPAAAIEALAVYVTAAAERRGATR